MGVFAEFEKIEQSAEKWIASLFSDADKIEEGIQTVQNTPVLKDLAATAADTVKATLLTGGKSEQEAGELASAVLSNLSGIAAKVPTVLAAGSAIEKEVTQTAAALEDKATPAASNDHTE